MNTFFKKISKFIKRKKTLKKFGLFLKNGRYTGDLRAKTFVLEGDNRYKEFCTEYLKKSFCSNTLKRRFFSCNIKTKEKLFGGGDIIVFGNTEIDKAPASVKIFNLDSKEVITVYQDGKKMSSDLNANDFFSGKLPIVPILFKDLDKKIIKEKLIIGKTLSRLKENEYFKLFETVVGCYVNYFKTERSEKFVSVGDLINESMKKQIDDKIGEQIFLKLSDIKNIRVPLKILHGDFTYSNLLSDGQKCYFIDFEHFGEFCFFYDIFWLMQNEYVYNKNKSLMERYFNGDLDDCFNAMFSAVGERFDPNMKDAYYYIFLLEMYNKRVYNIKGKEVVFDYITKIFNELSIGGKKKNE